MNPQPLQFGAYYHIYNRGNNRENLFPQVRNYTYFLRLYAKYILPVAETYAYCLMPNHFHILIRTRLEEEQIQIGPVSETGPISREPSRAFNNMLIAYTKAINKATGRTGVLFETPFHRKLVDSDAYFRRLVMYIHANPQKHGFVDDFRKWKWSSYLALLSDKATQLNRNMVIDWFDGRDGFYEFHLQSFDEGELLAVIGEDEY